MNTRVRIRERELLSAGWARLERVLIDYRRRDGGWESQEREIYHRGHGAAVLLHDVRRRRVLLVRQFRLAAHEVECGDKGPGSSPPEHVPEDAGFLLEVPAGVLEPTGAAATVRAEVEEETGYRIGEPTFLFKAYVSPGSVTEQIHYFSAPYVPDDRIGAGGGLAEEGEDIEVVELDFDEALGLVSSGDIRDAKTILLLQHGALGPFRRSLNYP